MIYRCLNVGENNQITSMVGLFEKDYVFPLKVKDLIESVTFDFESILDGNRGSKPIHEILSRFQGINVGSALELFRKEHKIFDLFKKVNNLAFNEVNNKGKSVSLNTYISDIADERFIKEIELQEEKYGSTNNSNIMIEILENDCGEFNQLILDNLVLLKNKGFKIAIDDYNLIDSEDNRSHFYLEEMLKNNILPDYVKIDGKLLNKFFDGKLTKKTELALRTKIAELRKLDIEVVGEWIRNKKDGELAQDIGCTLFQGREINETNFELYMAA